MKKLTESRKFWLLKRQARENRTRRGLLSTSQPNAEMGPDPRRDFLHARAQLPALKFEYDVLPKHASFAPPEVFSFTREYGRTLGFIMDFQRIFHERRRHRAPSGKKLIHYADFGRIREIDAGAGLVLAAEIDRFARAYGPVRVYDHLWQESVHDFFVEAGLFELLGIDPRVIAVAPSATADRKNLKFISGSSARGADALHLLRSLEQLTSKQLSARPAAYAAIAEAFANVGHAYPSWYRGWPSTGGDRWWASGFWQPSGNLVGLQLYDHGAGIPATLPKQTHYPRILRFLDPEGSPAGLISAALEYGRTSTGQPGRGKGLAEMADWIERTGTGFLRILSGAGQVTYRPGGSVQKRNFDVPFRGTLVEWEVTLDA